MLKQLSAALLVMLLLISTRSGAQHITLLQQNKPTSIRGLSVVDDKVAWISGSKGYVALTKDGGQTWAWQQVKGYEASDFRGIEAFSKDEAVIMSSGTPAVILKTVDGGVTWQLKYKSIDSAYFFDAIAFVNDKHGFILGDPINDKFLILETKDGGNTWAEYANKPVALKGQASFAASGTCLRLLGNEKVGIVTGGSVAELITLAVNGDWVHQQLPLSSGQPSKGAFSITINGRRRVAVGGDYKDDKNNDSTACYSDDFGKTWHLSKTLPAGYQSCVEYLSNKTLLSTGTSGSNISFDDGITWSKFDDNSFNVCRKAKKGKLVLLAGNDGRIAMYKP
ncbi:YCF48-related protein [Mucilaginibacter ginkgonis]|uniref:Oxidoreductase n=1 Tax=Mucilaginibacter ginkgonis TaxID=2682091 RepID=A0A6I4I0Q4_9SPHI|nr:YCF48-related protein [Mucilaginibacter ginkgonis]QQL48341.1 oxidoreductase [Mucilaginibacter ginkgonis]